MKQKTKLGLNFGVRGWLLMLFEFSAFILFMVFTNFPMNMLGDYYGGAEKISPLMTVGTLCGIIIQLILSNIVGKLKSIKTLTLGFGVLTLIGAAGVALLPPGTLWFVFYFLVATFSCIYGMFGIGIIIGQWFPTRKGVFMGIATFAFPIGNGLMGPFAGAVFGSGVPNPLAGFLPFLIFALVGWFIGLLFITDYPEQCGCYRDNDRSFTKEKAQAMLEAEIESKKTTVWKLGNTLKCGQFWLITLPMAALLMFSAGMMTQTSRIIGEYPGLDFGMVMGMVMIFALIGSYVLGLIDGRFGTKTAVLISVVIMLLSGVLGMVENQYAAVVSIVLLAVFMGAGSNFTVSASAQYWRREDFSTVFGIVNPFANVIQSLGPMVVAVSIGMSGKIAVPFGICTVASVIALVLIVAFKPSKVKEADDKYRAAAGKVLDDALVGRK